jgi:hypothetical protein
LPLPLPLLRLPRRYPVPIPAAAAPALCLDAGLLAVDEDGAEAALAAGGVQLRGGEDAAGGAALRAVQLAAQLRRLARPRRVDGPALARPVPEVLGVELEFGEEDEQLVEGFGFVKGLVGV